MGKDNSFQGYFKSLMEIEEKQLQIKKQLSAFNRPIKTIKKEDILILLKSIFVDVPLTTYYDKDNDQNLSTLIDQFIENDLIYDEIHDDVLQYMKDVQGEIKASFFSSSDDLKILQDKFIEANKALNQMREISIYNLAVFTLFIYKFESTQLRISEIESDLNTKGIHFKMVPNYENTFKYDYEYEKFAFFYKE